MTIFTKIGAALESFLNEYAATFGLMVVIGLIIAFIVELAVKKAFNWLEAQPQIGATTFLQIARVSVIFLVTMGLTAASTVIIMKSEMPLPGNKALAPVWFMLIYIAQYVISMFGIKNILGIKDREKEPKPKKEKKDPLEGLTQVSPKLWTDGNGNYYKKNGKKM